MRIYSDGKKTSTKYIVTVPIRTTQSFIVEAQNKAEAIRKVESWYTGERDEGDDLLVGDDIGPLFRNAPGSWTVTT